MWLPVIYQDTFYGSLVPSTVTARVHYIWRPLRIPYHTDEAHTLTVCIDSKLIYSRKRTCHSMGRSVSQHSDTQCSNLQCSGITTVVRSRPAEAQPARSSSQQHTFRDHKTTLGIIFRLPARTQLPLVRCSATCKCPSKRPQP